MKSESGSLSLPSLSGTDRRWLEFHPSGQSSDPDLSSDGLSGRDRTSGSDLIEGWSPRRLAVLPLVHIVGGARREEAGLGVAIGVDSHKRTLAAAAVDDVGRPLGAVEVNNDAGGHQQLLEWIGGFETG